jgi:hypothetical protein
MSPITDKKSNEKQNVASRKELISNPKKDLPIMNPNASTSYQQPAIPLEQRFMEEQQYDQVLMQSVAVAQRTVQKSNEAEKIGTKTLVELHEQTETLDHIEDNLDETAHNMVHAKMETSKAIGSGLCGILWIFKRRKYRKQKEEMDRRAKQEEEARQKRDQERYGKQRKQLETIQRDQHKGPPIRLTNKCDEATWTEAERRQHFREEAEQKIEEHLNQVGKHVRNLNMIGQVMGEELEAQNTQIARMEMKSTEIGLSAMTTSRKIRGKLG